MTTSPPEYRVSADSVYQMPVVPAAGRGKQIFVQEKRILENVTLMTIDDQGRMGYDQIGHLNTNGYVTSVYRTPGVLKVLTLLKFLPQSSPEPGAVPAVFTFLVGVGDGDPNDFPGSANAASISLTFQVPTAPEPPGAGSTVSLPAWPFAGPDLAGYVMNQFDILTGANTGRDHNSCIIEVLPASNGQASIETSVELQVVAANGILLGVVDSNNTSLLVPTATNFYLMALVKAPLGAGPGGTVDFNIGDPETDASVNLQERDV